MDPLHSRDQLDAGLSSKLEDALVLAAATRTCVAETHPTRR